MATAVIPAYNEEDHIGRVLHVVQRAAGVDQIVVVDDGSQDETAAVVADLRSQDGRIDLLRLPQNQGKAAAICAGVAASRHDILLLLDADLIGLTPAHVEDLLAPLRRGRCHMSVGLFRNGRWSTDWSHRLTPFLSGQRCLRWSLFQSAPGLADARYGLEIALHLHARRQGYRMQRVYWSGVTHLMRVEKLATLSFLRSYAGMHWDIIKYAVRYGLVGRPRAEPKRAGAARTAPERYRADSRRIAEESTRATAHHNE